jgi:hypothetical protein
MVGWLLRESGAQHPGSTKRFECGVHGALTFIGEGEWAGFGIISNDIHIRFRVVAPAQ